MNKYKKLSKKQLKEELSDLQYKVTQENGTEPPFGNDYWDNFEEGIYVDIISGEPLFLSTDKFNQVVDGQHFLNLLVGGYIKEKRDTSFNHG